MRCVDCGSSAVSERSERTGYSSRRSQCRPCGKAVRRARLGATEPTTIYEAAECCDSTSERRGPVVQISALLMLHTGKQLTLRIVAAVRKLWIADTGANRPDLPYCVCGRRGPEDGILGTLALMV
jgi:hypothetical protein